jgi:DinB superfamily
MESREIAELVERIVAGDPWHGPSVKQVLDGVDVALAARRPPGGAHSIWELVLHMTGWAREVAARLAGRPAQEPDTGDWPSVGDVTPDRWRQAQAELFDAHRTLAAAIRSMDPAKLDQPVRDFRNNALGTGLSHDLTLHGLVHHTIYHAGQISLLKRAHFVWFLALFGSGLY